MKSFYKFSFSNNIIEKLKQVPETGMGYQYIRIVHDNGQNTITNVINCEHCMIETGKIINKIENIYLIEPSKEILIV